MSSFNSAQLALLSDLKGQLAVIKPAKAPRKAKAPKLAIVPPVATVKDAKLPTSGQCDKLARGAFSASMSRRMLAATLLATLGATPSVEAFDMVKPHLVNGWVAANLAKKATGTIDEAMIVKLIGDASYLTANPAKRTDAEKLAFRSAAASLSGLLKIAGITNPAETGGGDTSDKRKPRQTVAKDEPAKVATVGEPIVLGKVKDFASLLAYLQTQGVAMSRSMNANAALVDADRPGDALEASGIVGRFASEMAALIAKRKA